MSDNKSIVECLVEVNERLSSAYKVLETIYLNYKGSKDFKDRCMLNEIEYLAKRQKGDLLYSLMSHGYENKEEKISDPKLDEYLKEEKLKKAKINKKIKSLKKKKKK
jgi:hypothetical protein